MSTLTVISLGATAGWYSSGDARTRHVMDHDGVGPHDDVVADGHWSQDPAAGPEEASIADDWRVEAILGVA